MNTNIAETIEFQNEVRKQLLAIPNESDEEDSYEED